MQNSRHPGRFTCKRCLTAFDADKPKIYWGSPLCERCADLVSVLEDFTPQEEGGTGFGKTAPRRGYRKAMGMAAAIALLTCLAYLTVSYGHTPSYLEPLSNRLLTGLGLGLLYGVFLTAFFWRWHQPHGGARRAGAIHSVAVASADTLDAKCVSRLKPGTMLSCRIRESNTTGQRVTRGTVETDDGILIGELPPELALRIRKLLEHGICCRGALSDHLQRWDNPAMAETRVTLGFGSDEKSAWGNVDDMRSFTLFFDFTVILALCLLVALLTSMFIVFP